MNSRIEKIALVAPGVIACVGMLWLAQRLGTVEERLAAAPPASSVAAVPATTGSALPVVAEVPPSTALVPAGPLDPGLVERVWVRAKRRALVHCSGDAQTSEPLRFRIRLSEQGDPLSVTPSVKESEEAPEFYDCVGRIVAQTRFEAPGKIVEGDVELSL